MMFCKIAVIRSILITGTLFLLFTSSALPLWAEELKPPGVVIWVGDIEISRQGTADYEDRRTEDGNILNHFERRRINDVTTIKACGSKEHLHVSIAQRVLEDSTEKGTISKSAKTDCGPAEGTQYESLNPPHIIKTPGNHSLRSSRMHTEIVETKDSIPLEERTRVTLMTLEDFYFLDVQNLAAVYHLQDHVSEKYNACTGKTKRAEHSIRPASEGDPPSFVTDASELEWEGTRTSHQTLPLIMFPVGFHGEGMVSGTMLGGQVEETERRSDIIGGYDVKTTSRWQFEAKDPCREVYNKLMNDIAYAEAYQNPENQKDLDKIEDLKERFKTYHKRIDKQVYRTLYGEKPPEGELSETDAETGGGEEKLEEWLKKYKKKLADECKHDILYKALEEHEFEHVRQGKIYYQSKFFHGTTVIYGRLEVTAHLVGIHILKDWLERNCPEIKLSEAKARIKRIEDKIQPKSAVNNISEHHGGG